MQQPAMSFSSEALAEADAQVDAVLQNLVPIVDNGQAAPDATYYDTRIWGATIGANTVVAHSGIGVSADGDLI